MNTYLLKIHGSSFINDRYEQIDIKIRTFQLIDHKPLFSKACNIHAFPSRLSVLQTLINDTSANVNAFLVGQTRSRGNATVTTSWNGHLQVSFHQGATLFLWLKHWLFQVGFILRENQFFYFFFSRTVIDSSDLIFAR